MSPNTGAPTLCSENGGIDSTRPSFWSTSDALSLAAERRGYRWADGNPIYSVVNTMLPPNSPICNISTEANPGSEDRQFRTGLFSTSSRHQGGTHVLMGDGAVKFVTDSIEADNGNRLPVASVGTAGDQNVPGSRSPYGLWGSLGTKASREVIEEEI